MASNLISSGATSAAATEENVYAKVFWRLVPFLMCCYVVAYLDRVNLGFAKLQMASELGFSDTVYGLGAGIFFLSYFIFGVPSNLILQRVGPRLWIGLIMISWGLISGLFAFTRTSAMFYALRLLLGVAEAGFYPGIILYLTYWFPTQRYAKVTAVFVSAIPMAGIFGNPLSGWIMAHLQERIGLHGWQWMFILEAVPALVLGLVTLRYLDDGIRSARWLTEEEKQVLERNIALNQAGKQGPKSVRSAFADARLWLLCLIYFTIIAGQYGLTFWMPTLVRATGIKGNFHVGCLSAIPYVVAIVTMIFLGRSADAHRERRWHLIIPAWEAAVGLVVAAIMAENATVAILFLSVAAAGVLSCTALFWSLPTSFLQGTGAAAGIAGINAFGNLAGFASPVLIGYLKDATHNNRIGMYTLAATVVIGGLAVLKIPAAPVNR